MNMRKLIATFPINVTAYTFYDISISLSIIAPEDEYADKNNHPTPESIILSLSGLTG